MLRRQEQERPRLVKGTPVIVVNLPEHGHVEGIITGTLGAGVSMQVFVQTAEGKQLKYPVKHIVINEEALAANAEGFKHDDSQLWLFRVRARSASRPPRPCPPHRHVCPCGVDGRERQRIR